MDNIIYIKQEGQYKGYIHHDDVARLLGIKPATFSSYLSRQQIILDKKRIKGGGIYFDMDQVDIIMKRNETIQQKKS